MGKTQADAYAKRDAYKKHVEVNCESCYLCPLQQ
jgi:hypothetical protein